MDKYTGEVDAFARFDVLPIIYERLGYTVGLPLSVESERVARLAVASELFGREFSSADQLREFLDGFEDKIRSIYLSKHMIYATGHAPNYFTVTALTAHGERPRPEASLADYWRQLGLSEDKDGVESFSLCYEWSRWLENDGAFIYGMLSTEADYIMNDLDGLLMDTEVGVGYANASMIAWEIAQEVSVGHDELWAAVYTDIQPHETVKRVVFSGVAALENVRIGTFVGDLADLPDGKRLIEERIDRARRLVKERLSLTVQRP